MKQCECGCGQSFEYIRGKGVSKRFLPGHVFRVPEVIAANVAAKAAIKKTPPPGLVRTGFCECGCGGKTTVSTVTSVSRGKYAGLPARYIHGHRKPPKGPLSPNFKGRQVHEGYILVYAPEHPRAYKSPRSRVGYVPEHRLVWEQANGRLLEDWESVHHINGAKQDNASENLVALSRSEHRRIHRPGDNITEETRRKLADATRKAWADGRMKRS